MTIPSNILKAEAPHVSAKAQERKDEKNPFVTLQGLEVLCQGDETLMDCLRDLVISSLRYAETVCRFEQIVLRGQESNENGERQEIERVRSNIHDAAIDTINILARALKRADKDISWISKVRAGERATYGKFSLLIAFETMLQEKI